METSPSGAKPPFETKIDFTFSDKQPRSVLSEGRNYGVGYALCKRTGSHLETVGPISPCKDYLNDEVYSNHTGKPYGAWGYSAKDRKLWEAGRAYVAFAICAQGARIPSKYPKMDRDLKAILDNWKNVESFLNDFETHCGCPTPTRIIKINDNMYVADADLFWVKWTYLISLYTLMIRNAIYYDGKGSIIKFLEGVDGYDTPMLNSVMAKIKAVYAGKVPDHSWSSGCSWHDAGIQSFKFPGL